MNIMEQLTGVLFDRSTAEINTKTRETGASDQNGDTAFSVLLSETFEEKTAKKMIESFSGSAMSSISALGTMDSGADALGLLLSSSFGQEDMDSNFGIMLMYMLMGSDSDSGYRILSSLMSAAVKDNRTVLPPVSVTDCAAYKADSIPSDSLSHASTGDRVPEKAWLPTNPIVKGNEECRSPALLDRLIEQFDVENSARYTPHKHGGDTYCNIFVWDVTSALGAEIPHYVDAQTGAPKTYPNIAGARELGANATYDWLTTKGDAYGWTEVSAEQAQAYANCGCPAVTTWKNPSGGAGHVQIVRPSEQGAYDQIRGVAVAQAGGHNYEYTHISSIYGSRSLSQVRYFVHD